MKRYAALLRGVSPTNAKMPELVRAFEAAGFEDAKTILGSGNVNFGSRIKSIAKLQQACEAAMQKHLGKTFLTIVREVAALEQMLAADPYARFELAPGSKRVITFLREPAQALPRLPIELENARILCADDGAAYGAYLPSTADGPVFMRLIERTFGKQVSTRTWETVSKIVKAG